MQLIGSAVNDRYVVWLQGAMQSLPLRPWVMYGYDRKTKRTFELVRGDEETKDVPGSLDAAVPQIVGDRVFWTRVDGKGLDRHYSIMSCTIERCEPRIEVESGSGAAAAGNSLYFLADPAKDGRSQEVWRLNPATHDTTEVVNVPRRDGVLEGFAAHGDTVALTLRLASKPSYVMVLNTAKHSVVRVEPPPHFNLAAAAVTENLVALVSQPVTGGSAPGGGFVLQLDGSNRLLQVARKYDVWEIYAAGNFVAFTAATDPAAPRPTRIATIARID